MSSLPEDSVFYVKPTEEVENELSTINSDEKSENITFDPIFETVNNQNLSIPTEDNVQYYIGPRIINGVKKYVCDKCGIEADKNCTLETHLKTKKHKDPNKGKNIDYRKYVKTDKNGIIYYYCNNCRFSTNTTSNLGAHFRSIAHLEKLGIIIKDKRKNRSKNKIENITIANKDVNDEDSSIDTNNNIVDKDKFEEKVDITLDPYYYQDEKTGEYSCSKCNFKSFEFNNYKTHLGRTIHKSIDNVPELKNGTFSGYDKTINKYRCEPCGLSNGTQSLYDIHKTRNKHKKIIQKYEIIEIENETLKNVPTLQREQYRCEECNFSSCLITGYNVHMQSGIHRSPESITIKIKQLHKCDKCNYETYIKRNMEQHLKSARHKLSPDEYIIYRKSKNKKLLEEIEKKLNFACGKFFDKDKNVYMYICEKCNYSSEIEKDFQDHLKRKKHILSIAEYTETMREKGRMNMIKGQISESFIFDILSSLNFDDIKSYGGTSNKFDFFIKFKEESFYRGIQIKTLGLTKNKNYKICYNYIYPDNTLIIAVNIEKKKFISFFFNENKINKVLTESELENFDKIGEIILEKCKNSTIVSNLNESMCESGIQEIESLERFNKICIEKGITFSKKLTEISVVDAIANNFKLIFSKKVIPFSIQILLNLSKLSISCISLSHMLSLRFETIVSFYTFLK